MERQADRKVTLEQLAGGERSETKAAAVTQILGTELRPSRKIEYIREIDAKTDPGEIRRVVVRAYVQAMRREFVRIRNAVKVPLTSVPFLTYLLKERGRIREFGRRTHTLDTTLLPPGVRPDPELREFLVRKLQSWSADLSHQLQPVIEHGWLHLTPLQYNLVILLKVLADTCLSFDFIHLNYRDRNLIDRLRRIERLFLMLHYRAHYLDTILEAILSVYEKQGEESAAGEECRTLALRVLSEDLSLPSLYHVIVGLNIVKHRRLLSLAQLMQSGLTDSVNTRNFNCSSEVKERIDSYVEKSMESIGKHHRHLSEVRQLDSYLRYDEQGALDTGKLEHFYNAFVENEQDEFRTDLNNVLVFSQRLFDAFQRAFLGLLSGEVMLEGIGTAQIFHRSVFEMELARLEAVAGKLKRGPFHFGKFPLSRYLQVKEAKIGPIGKETELIQLVDEGVACLADMGKSLARILRGDLGRSPGPKNEPLTRLIFRGKPYSIPHAQQRIGQVQYLEGKTVLEALSDAVTLCFTIGMVFRDRFVFLVLGTARRHEIELKTQLRLMENLLEPERYRELLTRYR